MAFVSRVEAGSANGPVGSSLYGTCTTSAGTAAKIAHVNGLDALVDGLTIHVKFMFPNAAENPTLTISSVDDVARPIYKYGLTTPYAETSQPIDQSRASWYAESVIALTYVATNNAWYMNDWQSDTTYVNATQAAAGLMSAADKRTLDNIRDTRTTSLALQNVPTSAWTQDASGTYPDYPYTATLSCPGVTAAHFVQVCFKPEHVINYVPAPVCQVPSDGTVQVWAMINPVSSIEVPTVFAILPDRT